ncbi:DNA polymerase epsilon subunit 4-like [Lineus longissimus]|uniref:DNA polymerase epsilon subunit 4-like n=1 Tax=Lineus longissimus TaxID=88925 RepID=UPI002B4F3191
MAGNTDIDSTTETTAQNDDNHDQESNKSQKIVKLPLTRIKSIMKMDPDVTLASQDAVILIAKATEIFINDMAKEAYTFTAQGKRKTVQRKDVDNAIVGIDALAFLEGTIDT